MNRLTTVKVAVFAGFVAFGIMLAVAGPASAGAIGLGGPWIEFAFSGVGIAATGCAPADPGGPACVPSSGGNSIFGDVPPYTFAAPAGGVLLKVTDAFCQGDAFSVFDFAALLGTTPLVPVIACGTPGQTSDPAVAVLDPTYSSAIFALAPGPHSISFSALASPFITGAAYFRVDARVAEPSTLLLLGSALLLLRANRRRLNPGPAY